MSDIFISYSREDSAFVEALILALIEYGWSVWSDKSGISEGRPFDQQIENAILGATITLVIWSHASVKSRWVRAEAAFALDKDKLLPVMAENVDPPLQFLHIQGANLANWGRSSDDAAFRRLAVILSERLDLVGRIPESEIGAAASVEANTSLFDGIFGSLKRLQDICLPPVGRGFSEYFAIRTYYITHFVLAFGFCLLAIYGLTDVFNKAGGAEETRFRFMVTGPSLLIILALSFTPWAKRYSQIFTLVGATVTLLVIFKTCQFVEPSFPVTTGAATMCFVVMVAAFMILPLRLPYAAVLGLLAMLANEAYISWTGVPIPLGLHLGYSICILSVSLALVTMAIFRERIMRTSFLDNERATAANVELKGRLMTLATQRNQSPDRAKEARGTIQSGHLPRVEPGQTQKTEDAANWRSS